jgi:uncharacterized protein (UPF0297 family)
MFQYFSGEPAYVNVTVLYWRTSIRQCYSTLVDNQHTSMLQYFIGEPAYVNVTVLSGEPAYVNATVL